MVVAERLEAEASSRPPVPVAGVVVVRGATEEEDSEDPAEPGEAAAMAAGG